MMFWMSCSLIAQAVREAAPPRVHFNAQFLLLAALLIVGIGWKLALAARARRAVDRLSGDRPDPEVIAESANHGRAAVVDLFRLLSDGADEATRHAAGRALASLWLADELVAEEEKGLVTRGFSALWSARRTYPRALSRPIPVSVRFGVPCLEGLDTGGKGGMLEWSSRIIGADRASLESFSPWRVDTEPVRFEIDPRDYSSHGPHRRALQVRVRTLGLTANWEHELPQVPFTFEFDPHLRPDSLLASFDEARAAAFEKVASLGPSDDGDVPSFLALNREFAMKSPPRLRIDGPLPCDLAHRIVLEIEGISDRLGAGSLVLTRDCSSVVVSLEVTSELPLDAISGPGDFRVRLHLMPDPDLGWGDPAVRSIWPAELTTNWGTVRIVRR